MDNEKLNLLVTESRNSNTLNLDKMSSIEICAAMNHEDEIAVLAVRKVLPAVAQAVETAKEAIQSGGRLIYIGAGTSGRIGMMDAVECPPTFGVPNDLVIGLMAGNSSAFQTAHENCEDIRDNGVQDLQSINCNKKDFVVGLAASGRTPYVIGALSYAKQIGCRTAAVACNPDSAIGAIADIRIEPICGPEVLTGSTRLKAGTAEKTVCNMISTGAMVMCGKAYQNYMVDVKPTNQKLFERAVTIIMKTTECDENMARRLLVKSGEKVKTAIVMQKLHCSREIAEEKLIKAKGYITLAIRDYLF